MRIFISYRREDGHALAGRVCDRLASEFGVANVFIDTQSIPAGRDVSSVISDAVTQSDVLIALVGESWIRQLHRLEQDNDYVRRELEAAFAAGVVVLPVLIGDAVMPEEQGIPLSIARIVQINALRIDPAVDFGRHVAQLITLLHAVRLQRADLEGDWVGTLSSPGGDLDYTLTLHVTTHGVTGTGFAKDRVHRECWSAAAMSGTMRDGTLYLRALRLIDGNPPDDWCLFDATLQVLMLEARPVLTGSFSGRASDPKLQCETVRGTLILQRR